MQTTTYPTTLDGLNGFRAAIGLAPLSPAENAARAARAARVEYLIAVEKREYRRAQSEKLDIVARHQDMRPRLSTEQEDAEQWVPFQEARQRVVAAMEQYDRLVGQRVAA